MKKLSIRFYFTSIIVAPLIALLIGVLRNPQITSIYYLYHSFFYHLLGLINSVLILYGIIVYIVFWYKAWAFIQDEHARISPGKVIWMMLVPILNLYGNYLILVGFAKNYNDFINRRKIETEHLPVNLFLLFYINEMLAILLSFFYRRLFPGYTSVFELVILNTIAQFLVLIGAAISASFVIVKVIQSVNKLTEHSLTTQPYNA